MPPLSGAPTAEPGVPTKRRDEPCVKRNTLLVRVFSRIAPARGGGLGRAAEGVGPYAAHIGLPCKGRCRRRLRR